MASPVDLVGRNDTAIWSADCLLQDIQERAPDWDQHPDGEQADLFYEWEAALDHLYGTVQDDAAGLLTLEQRVRLRDLIVRIVEAREVIMGIGFDYPDLGHLLAEVPMTTDERIVQEINALRHWAGELRRVSDLWDSPLLETHEKQTFPQTWEQVVQRFAKVAELAGRGDLKPAARTALQEVADWLVELLPEMQRLKLSQPDADALERARRVEAA